MRIKKGMEIKIKIAEGLTEGEKELMEQTKAIMISVAQGILGEYGDMKRQGHVYGKEEGNEEEELYTEDWKGIENFGVEITEGAEPV